ncbi:MAG: ABC transporter permease [Planctomycetota bacterium]
MRLVDILFSAFRALRRGPLRAGLTILGVVIGVSSVVVMVAIGQGASSAVKSSIEMMGSNILQIRSGSVSVRGAWWGAGSVQTLTPDDAEAISRECPSIEAVSPLVRYRGQLVVGDRNWLPENIEGVGADYERVLRWRAVEGRWFDPQEEQAGATVCLVGRTVSSKLFGLSSPVGSILRIGKTPVEIVGVLSRRGADAWGRDLDDIVILPWTTVRRRLNGDNLRTVNQITVSVRKGSTKERAIVEIGSLLRVRHRLSEAQEDDFNIRDLTQVAEGISETSRLMSWLLAAVASVSLLVGGVGVMNIMLVSVTERTREIGIRMAVGARTPDILAQFLAESVALCLVGGIVGLGLGVTGAHLVSNLAGWPVLLSVEAMAAAIGFSMVVGVGFGYYPAHRASRLNPIAALRHE